MEEAEKKTVLCDHLIKDNIKVYDRQDIASAFDKFYINVGPDLAKNINDRNKGDKFDDFVKDIDLKFTMFVEPTNEKRNYKYCVSFQP